MTREEAIRLIGWLKCTTNREDDLEAIDMAIEALSAEPQTDLISRADAICEVLVNDGIDNIVDRINDLPSAELPKGELISKADAIELVLTYFVPRSHTGERGEYEEDFVRTIFNTLPSYENAMQKLRDMPRYLNGVKAEQIRKISADAVHDGCFECRYFYNSADGWIPCSERLPDNDDWVLGTVRYWDKAEDPIDEAFYAVEHLFYDGKWRIAGGSEVEQYDDATVLAWQPLPEPYK